VPFCQLLQKAFSNFKQEKEKTSEKRFTWVGGTMPRRRREGGREGLQID
jgi:hypothetical protein